MKHKNIMGLILVFFLLILLSLVFVQSFSFYSIQIKSNFANSIDSMDQRLFPLANNIDEFFLSTTKDLSFLSNLISLQKAIKEDSYIEVEKDLKNFIQDNFEYLDIEYYSSLEELEINVFSESDLQTKYLTCPEGYTPTGAVDNGAFSERGTTVISSNTSGGSTVRFGIVTQSIFFVLSAALVQLAS